jgi:hypothetical protein
MNVNQLPLARLAPRALLRTLLPLLVMVLLVVTWVVFFLWGVLTTESLRTQWHLIAPPLPRSWPMRLNSFFEAGVGVYIPALLLLVISQGIFFYRMPRTRGRLAVPLEFVLTTFLLVVTHLLIFSLFDFFNPLILYFSMGIRVVVTLVMLVGLFWLQWSGLLWRYLKFNLKKQLLSYLRAENYSQ